MKETLLELCAFVVLAVVAGCFVLGLMTGIVTIINLV